MDMYTIVAWGLGIIGLFVNIISIYIMIKSLKHFGDEFRTVVEFLTASIIIFCVLSIDLGLLHTLNISSDPLWSSTLILGLIASIFFFLGARKLLSMMKKVKVK